MDPADRERLLVRLQGTREMAARRSAAGNAWAALVVRGLDRALDAVLEDLPLWDRLRLSPGATHMDGDDVPELVDAVLGLEREWERLVG